ncbi:MAG: DUF3536 domain-containing protein [Elusimicrobia bacterium]|nr:DUF3536 domain-containing protein [Elusimicrobiota bacterium]
MRTEEPRPLFPNKYVCFHGHFYQPPRENPWLEEGEPEESAYPYRDWNSRILQECYGPNAACPWNDGRGGILELDDNYRRISFNFGATLFSWLERHHPPLYRRIIEADRASALERGGHGNAIAQPYVHAILPLQTLRDKTTMVRWGIEDFTHRFGRRPEGMWLPETGVDEETLEVLVAAGLRFTILAPSQAARVRDIGAPDSAWADLEGRKLNPSRPYRWNSRARPGKSIALFFYYGDLHEYAAHQDILSDGPELARRVLARYLPGDSTQLVHAALDGEYFGHHRRRGHQGLAIALRCLAADGVKIVNYAQFLDLYPPPQEVEIKPRTAWSCGHGLGRWSADCGCKIEPDKPTQQRWRKPLLDALNWLAARVDETYEREAAALLKDPWAARDGYGRRVLEGSAAAADEFLARHASKHLSAQEARAALRLCEMQRYRLLMLTSCGWFFDDVSGIEAAQNLRFAARAAELAEGFGASLTKDFSSLLAAAPSNDIRFEHGARVLERLVAPLRSDLGRAAAHAAIVEHLDGSRPAMPPRFTLAWSRPRRWDKPLTAGRDRSLSCSHLRVTDARTLEYLEAWAVVHQQDRLDLACWIGRDEPPADLEARFRESEDADLRAHLARSLGAEHYSLESLFAEERAAAVRVMLAAPPRSPLRAFLEAWRASLRRLGRERDNADEVMRLMSECGSHGLHVDQLPDGARIRGHLRDFLEGLGSRPEAASVSTLLRWIETAESSGFHLSLWELQDFCGRWLSRIKDGGGIAPFERDAAGALARKLGFSETLYAPSGGYPNKTASAPPATRPPVGGTSEI